MKRPKHYDFIAIGGGSAGFNAARAAADLGKKVAIVDGARDLGGLCILRGCMPSKTLLYVAEILHHARHGKLFGLRIPKAEPDMKAVQARKKAVIDDFASYRVKQLQSGRYDLYRATARLRDARTLELSNREILTAERMIIATGSKVSWPAIPGLRESGAWTSDDVLNLDFLPRSVIVLGGGIVACELSQFLRRMGSRVVMIQRSPNILRDHSPAASEVIQTAFRDEGIDLFTHTKMKRVIRTSRGYTVEFEHAGKTVRRSADHLFNALGRNPNTGGLNLGAAGIKSHEDGRIVTNRFQRTSAPGIYAAGDCCGPHEIVHVAIQQAEAAVRHAFGLKAQPVDDSLLLNVVFTDPQLATAGFLESELIRKKTKYISASYPFDDHGKSILMEAKRGYVKVIAEPKKGRLLGGEIVGKDAGELIHIFSTALALKATVFDLLKAPWYHPTLSEIVTYPLEDLTEEIRARP